MSQKSAKSVVSILLFFISLAIIGLTSADSDARGNIQAVRQAVRQARQPGADNPQAIARGLWRPRKEPF
ncbi:hypothetical protein DM01DRAFT_1332713 [Hesseltinella vesiculosa]|uniref:Uncharacterized protein n=1 Tax=Hesseltinella vesiculosa TaxID=101127 RepID=A0A1X2GSW4_9FUNG|nr:hypothetical protein DM01DRAFT_1332713 [Hesseltinella vesiculosa]